jgi:exopolysaccharide biosynthesis protein
MRTWIYKHRKKFLIGGICIALLAILYLFLVFSSNPFIKKWRDIYIETAMTTNSHQWLAEWFIPHSIIDEVMADRAAQEEAQKALESSWADASEAESQEAEDAQTAFFETYWELDSASFCAYLNRNPSLINDGYDNLVIDDLDNTLNLVTSAGDPLLAVDVPNNTLIVGVSGDGYVGKLAIVKDVSQVSLEKSSSYGSSGEEAATFSSRFDAEVVVNASGFKDVDGHGSGGTIKGSYVLDGVEIGTPENSYWKFVGLKNDNKLYISNRYQTDITDYKWGMEFYPALIVDGENVVDGTYCMGIQPRTSIGQTESGDFLMLVVDGRQVGYSLGCTVADCRDILQRYHAYQAMNMDGGSSSVMYYKGQQITKSSSATGLGRYMPNAFVVRKNSINSDR